MQMNREVINRLHDLLTSTLATGEKPHMGGMPTPELKAMHLSEYLIIPYPWNISIIVRVKSDVCIFKPEEIIWDDVTQGTFKIRYDDCRRLTAESLSLVSKLIPMQLAVSSQGLPRPSCHCIDQRQSCCQFKMAITASEEEFNAVPSKMILLQISFGDHLPKDIVGVIKFMLCAIACMVVEDRFMKFAGK